MGAAINTCLQEWHAALPNGRILSAQDATAYHENCLSLDRNIIAVIQPETEAEIIAIVKIANRHGVSLYTVSTGHNWGYGSSLPVTDNCALLVLSRMTRIVDCDAELGLITLEPGVTQQHLADYLAQKNLDFYVPTTGAGPIGSIVGNALERGFGMTPIEDHFQAVTSVRAILADGSVYQSAFAESGAPYAGAWKWGIGPYLDGLFAQGNIGIVTSLQIALIPHAEHTEMYMFTLKDDAKMEQMLTACRTLLVDMRGTLGNIKIFNRQQLLSTTGGDKAPEFAWMGFGVFRCPKRMAPAIRKEIRQRLTAPLSRITFINEKRAALLEKISHLIPGKIGAGLQRQVGSLQYLMALINGVPRSDALGLVYQHVPRPAGPPVDPIRDGVGILWYAPVIPLKLTVARTMLDTMQNVLKQYGFPPAITFTMSNEKCAIGVAPIIYKRPEGAEHARACYQELWERGNALGCPPYRINIESMKKLTAAPDSVYWNSVGKIKAALDPNNILSPGRYSPT